MESLEMSRTAYDVAQYITKGTNLTAKFRSRFDKFRYEAFIFSSFCSTSLATFITQMESYCPL